MLLAGYIALLVGLMLNAPPVLWSPESRSFILVIGVIGAWRWGWYLLHLARSLWYRHVRFRRWRRRLDRLAIIAEGGQAASALRPPEVYLVITSYRIDAETAAKAFEAALLELMRHGGPAVLVASIVEIADERLVKAVFARLDPPPQLRLMLVRSPGRGKRDGLALALRAIARSRPDPDAAVILQDGDVLLPPGCFARFLPFLKVMPDLAAITTDEDCVVPRGTPLMWAWHRLRFAQRQLLMASMAMSGRLITLTGRMSVLRARYAIDPSFIDVILNDRLDHWRLGRFRLLTGEDKSTAYWLLRRDLRMLYVPDVRVITIEHPPARGLPRGSTLLMLRWFGNMLRANGRTIRLGPTCMGPFLWWCLIDQRISMWTPLIGPIAALLLALTTTPAFLYAYLMWVMLTRLLQSLMLLTVRPTISGLYPFLIYYNQLYGSLVKTYILFRLDRQRWTRQNIAYRVSGGTWWPRVAAVYLHFLAIAALVALVGVHVRLLPIPSVAELAALF